MVDDIWSKTGLYQNGIKMVATTMCFGHPQKRDHFFTMSKMTPPKHDHFYTIP